MTNLDFKAAIMRNSKEYRTGFTVVELLVVISIGLAVGSLILTAAFSARESSREIACSSNLRNWSTALASYESTFRVLPCGYDMNSTYSAPGRIRDVAPAIPLLPHFGEQPLYNEFNLNADSLTRYYFDSAKSSPPFYKCPSDEMIDAYCLSYVVNGGSRSEPGYASTAGSDELKTFGAFDSGFGVRLSAFSDGLASTAFVSERLVGTLPNNLATAENGKLGRDMIVLKTLHDSTHVNRWLSACIDQSSAQSNEWSTEQGRSWTLAPDASYNHIAQPNSLANCVVTFMRPFAGVRGASSQHRGGAMVLFGDSSVRKISQEIEILTWRALGTRSGGEVDVTRSALAP